MSRKFLAILILSIIVIAGVSSFVVLYNFLNSVSNGSANNPPTISNLPDITIAEDTQQSDAINLTEYSSDLDSDLLTFDIIGNTDPNCGITIDSQNFIDIAPTADWWGVSNITIQVSDGKLNDTDIFAVNVTPVNDPPYISGMSPSNNNTSITENDQQEFEISVLDPENDPINYEWYVNGSSQGWDKTSFIYCTDYKSGGTYEIKVSGTDGEFAVENIWILKVNQTPSYVRIYVNSTIYSSIQTEIDQYKQDIINQGLYADVVKWAGKNENLLKNNLTHYYYNYNNISMRLTGAVLVGNMPYARYLNVSVFASDLFFMDLDGVWGDTYPGGVPDGIYDSHSGGTGDVFPEIWIGRINPESLTNLPSSHTQVYKSYFKKNHDYRTGVLTRPNSMLLYVDDDWTPWNDDWYASVQKAYLNITHIGLNKITNDTDYETRINTSSHEFVHAMIHSWSYQHQFGPSGDGSEGYTTNSEINKYITRPLFYNLFCCHACDFLAINNLGTQYLFSNNTLMVIGSTKSGGMWIPADFYTPLGQGRIMGEAFRLWWWNDLHGPLDSDSQGMCILGDPLLTI